MAVCLLFDVAGNVHASPNIHHRETTDEASPPGELVWIERAECDFRRCILGRLKLNGESSGTEAADDSIPLVLLLLGLEGRLGGELATAS